MGLLSKVPEISFSVWPNFPLRNILKVPLLLIPFSFLLLLPLLLLLLLRQPFPFTLMVNSRKIPFQKMVDLFLLSLDLLAEI